MNEARKGEIALAILKDRLMEEGIRRLDSSTIKRSIGNVSKRTGISQEELLQFGETLLIDVIKKSFA